VSGAAVVVLDVNETMLDLSALDPLFADAFGDAEVRRAWFGLVLQTAFATSLSGRYVPFGEIARAALDMIAQRRGPALDETRKTRILRALATLPAHGDVLAGLGRLHAAGLRLVVLAQASQETLEAQLTHARIRPFLERVFSTDAVRRFKPAAEAYGLVRDAYPASTSFVLVAAHDWDVAGAMRAGFDAAFVARHGTALNPLDERPVIVEPDLRRVADAVVARYAAPPHPSAAL